MHISSLTIFSLSRCAIYGKWLCCNWLLVLLKIKTLNQISLIIIVLRHYCSESTVCFAWGVIFDCRVSFIRVHFSLVVFLEGKTQRDLLYTFSVDTFSYGVPCFPVCGCRKWQGSHFIRLASGMKSTSFCLKYAISVLWSVSRENDSEFHKRSLSSTLNVRLDFSVVLSLNESEAWKSFSVFPAIT